MNIYCNTRCKIKNDYHLVNGFMNGIGIVFENCFRGFGIENGKVIYFDTSGFTEKQIKKVITHIAVNIKNRKHDKTCMYVENTKLCKEEINKLIENIDWEIYNGTR